MKKFIVKARYQKVAYQTISVLSISFGILYFEKKELYLLAISIVLASGLLQKHVVILIKRNKFYRNQLVTILAVTLALGWFISPSLVAIPSSIAMWCLSWYGINIIESEEVIHN